MTSSKPKSKTPTREPEKLKTCVIFVRTNVALHDAAKEVAARLNVPLSVLAMEALSRIVELHNPKSPRPFVAQTTVVLHDAAKEVAARLNLSLNEFMEYALLTAVELHTPTQGTANDVNEKTGAQKTVEETEGQGRR